MAERYRAIARVEKTHGRRGEVVTVSVHGLPSLVREGLTVWPVPPELRGPRSRVVLSCQEDDRSGCLVALSGVEDLRAAERLVGKTLLAREADLPANLVLLDAARLVGREVVCADDGGAADGATGTIEEVLRGPANDVWVVRGERGEILLPVIDEVVADPPAEGPITVHVPAGLTWEDPS